MPDYDQSHNMARFSLRDLRTEYDSKSRSIVVDAHLAGPTGRYRMQISVSGVNGSAEGTVFESFRMIEFEDEQSRLTITPVTEVSKGYHATLTLNIDGEELPPINF